MGNTNWRGHDDVMQIRSFRESGEPVWVNAPPSAGVRLGPDSRRALGPAATPAASTGRTRDRTRPMLHQIRNSLPRRRPHVTTNGPKKNAQRLAQRNENVPSSAIVIVGLAGVHHSQEFSR